MFVRQHWPGGYMFVVLYPGAPKGSTSSVSGLKASQKMGPWFKVSKGSKIRNRYNQVPHPTDLEKPGIEPETPGLQDIGLSPSPRNYTLKRGYKRPPNIFEPVQKIKIVITKF